MLRNALHNETDLFAQIAEGNEAAFRKFFHQYVHQLRPLVYSISKSDKMVEDVIQETLVRVWLNRHKLGEIHDPKAWINRVAANVCYTHHRRIQRFEEIAGRDYANRPEEHDEVMETIDLNALKETVQKGIALLSPQRQKVFSLSREYGLNVQEIAVQLGLSANTVRNTLSSASEFIRKYLVKQGYEPIIIWIVLNFF